MINRVDYIKRIKDSAIKNIILTHHFDELMIVYDILSHDEFLDIDTKIDEDNITFIIAINNNVKRIIDNINKTSKVYEEEYTINYQHLDNTISININKGG